MIPFDQYFSNGLKPPTRIVATRYRYIPKNVLLCFVFLLSCTYWCGLFGQLNMDPFSPSQRNSDSSLKPIGFSLHRPSQHQKTGYVRLLLRLRLKAFVAPFTLYTFAVRIASKNFSTTTCTRRPKNTKHTFTSETFHTNIFHTNCLFIKKNFVKKLTPDLFTTQVLFFTRNLYH